MQCAQKSPGQNADSDSVGPDWGQDSTVLTSSQVRNAVAAGPWKTLEVERDYGNRQAGSHSREFLLGRVRNQTVRITGRSQRHSRKQEGAPGKNIAHRNFNDQLTQEKAAAAMGNSLPICYMWEKCVQICKPQWGALLANVGRFVVFLVSLQMGHVCWCRVSKSLPSGFPDAP